MLDQGGEESFTGRTGYWHSLGVLPYGFSLIMGVKTEMFTHIRTHTHTQNPSLYTAHFNCKNVAATVIGSRDPGTCCSFILWGHPLHDELSLWNEASLWEAILVDFSLESTTSFLWPTFLSCHSSLTAMSPPHPRPGEQLFAGIFGGPSSLHIKDMQQNWWQMAG